MKFPPCGRASCDGCPLRLHCRHVCHSRTCLDPDRHHPAPSEAQRRVFDAPSRDLALWCALMASKVIRGPDRSAACGMVATALRYCLRGGDGPTLRDDLDLLDMLAHLNEVAGDLCAERYDEAADHLDRIIARRLDRALAIEAELEVAGVALMRADQGGGLMVGLPARVA